MKRKNERRGVRWKNRRDPVVELFPFLLWPHITTLYCRVILVRRDTITLNILFKKEDFALKYHATFIVTPNVLFNKISCCTSMV